MRATKTISPPNSIVFVMDPEGGEVPEILADGLVSATDSCLAIGTLMELDGPTTLVLTDEADGNTGQSDYCAFRGHLETPSRRLEISTSQAEIILSGRTNGTNCDVEVWANDKSEPDFILIRFE